MTARIKVKNFSSLENKLKNLPKHLLVPIQQSVMDGALKIQKTAIDSINRGSRSGALYTRSGKVGRRSAAGEYPKSDTGNLVRSIYLSAITGSNRLAYEVGANLRKAKYAMSLEFGSSQMESRPWLFPSFRRNVNLIIKDIKKNVKKGLKKAAK